MVDDDETKVIVIIAFRIVKCGVIPQDAIADVDCSFTEGGRAAASDAGAVSVQRGVDQCDQAAGSVCAPAENLGNVVFIKKQDGGLLISAERGAVKIDFISPSIVRIAAGQNPSASPKTAPLFEKPAIPDRTT